MLWCMEITEAQYQRIASSFPRQRGNVKLPNLQLLVSFRQSCVT